MPSHCRCGKVGGCRELLVCPVHGRRDAGNLVVHGLYGEGKRYRLIRCRTSDTRFSKREGTIFYGSRLTEETAVFG